SVGPQCFSPSVRRAIRLRTERFLVCLTRMMSEPPRASRTGWAIVAGLAGAALLVWQIRSVGLDQIADLLGRVRFGFLGILALSLARFTLRSFAWVTLIGEPVPLG